MDKPVAVVNTHPADNPEFVGKLTEFLVAAGVDYQVLDGYRRPSPAEIHPRCVILTGVPLDVGYSLAQPDRQRLIDRAFGWLRDCRLPVLGICYGHQILSHVFGGQVSALERPVVDPQFPLAVESREGIFRRTEKLVVYAEHRDYVSEVPKGFKVLSSKNGVPYIIYHPAKDMVGMQFVPEQSDDSAREPLRRFVRS